MEAKLKHERINCYSSVYTGTINREETAESVVPDTLPDIAQILDTDASIYLKAKTVQNGKASLEGNIQGTVLYLTDEDDDVYKLELSQTTTFLFESEELKEGDRLCARLYVNNADARMLNPRKILLRVDVVADVSAYRESAMELAVEPDDAEFLQILPEERTVQYITAVGEKPFIVTDEFSVPASRPAIGQVLQAKAGANIDDMKQVGAKMILQGTAWLKLLYLPVEEKMPRCENFSTTFSQIVDCPEGSNGLHSVVLMPTACYIEPLQGGHGANAVQMEQHMTAQIICRKESQLHYMADAYNTRYSCEVQSEPLAVQANGRAALLRETVKDLVETTEPVSEIIYSQVNAGTPSMGDKGCSVPLMIHALYRTENGKIASLTRRMCAEMPLDVTTDSSTYLYPASCAEPYLAPTSGGLEVRLPVEMKAEIYDNEKISAVHSIDVDMETPAFPSDGPSMIIVRCGNNCLWSLAKRYGSTTELIEAANPGSTETGNLLLIPRAR